MDAVRLVGDVIVSVVRADGSNVALVSTVDVVGIIDDDLVLVVLDCVSYVKW